MFNLSNFLILPKLFNKELLLCSEIDFLLNEKEEPLNHYIVTSEAAHNLLKQTAHETKHIASEISSKLDKKILDVELQLSTILSTISEAVIITDSNGIILESNVGANDTFKCPDGLVGKSINEFIPTLDSLDVSKKCIQTRGLTYHKYELRIELSINRFDDNKIIYIIRDKTKEFEVNRVLDNERRLLNTVMNSVDDFVLVKDSNDKWVLLNDCGKKLFGFSDREYLNKTTEEIINTFPDLAKCINMQHRLTDNICWDSKEPIRTKEKLVISGVESTYDVIKTPLFYNNESKRDLVIIGRNITQLNDCCS